MSRPRLILLDRDGVLNEVRRGSYVFSPSQFVWIPGSLEAVVRLQEAGYQLAVVTNQQGVAKGLMTQADLDSIHSWMNGDLIRAGGHRLCVYACTHLEQDGCDCRKPKPGLLAQAMADVGATSGEVVMVGDSLRDHGAARAAGVTFVLVRTGARADIEESLDLRGESITIADNLLTWTLGLAGDTG